MGRLTLYTREGCHLCDEAAHLLRRLAPEFGLDVEEVDIDSDPALLERYWDSIPVVALDGEPLVSAPFREKHVRAALARRARQSLPRRER
jgi:glutaredoxin